MSKSFSPRLLLAVVTSAACLAFGGCAAEPGPSADTRTDAAQVVCRERLHPGSNAHERVCMTDGEWAKFRRRESLEAERLVRVMQGSAYEGGTAH